MTSFIKRHARALILTLIVLILLSIIAHNEINILLLRKKIQDSHTEQEVLKNLLKKAQNDYFLEAKLSKTLYELKLQKYREKQLKLKEQTPVLQANLKEREEKTYRKIVSRVRRLTRETIRIF